MADYDFFVSSFVYSARNPGIIFAVEAPGDQRLYVFKGVPSVKGHLQSMQMVLRSLDENLSQIEVSRCKLFISTRTLLILFSKPIFCPVVKRVHRSNTGYFVYNAGNKVVEQRCSDGSCKAQARLIGWKKYFLRCSDISVLAEHFHSNTSKVKRPVCPVSELRFHVLRLL